jgi:hypothetical protein
MKLSKEQRDLAARVRSNADGRRIDSVHWNTIAGIGFILSLQVLAIFVTALPPEERAKWSGAVNQMRSDGAHRHKPDVDDSIVDFQSARGM